MKNLASLILYIIGIMLIGTLGFFVIKVYFLNDEVYSNVDIIVVASIIAVVFLAAITTKLVWEED